MHSLSTLLEHLIRHYGVYAVFFAMILESACIPLPSELIMTYAGFEAFHGDLNFTAAVIAGVSGNVVGSWLAYYVGRRGGRPFLRRYGRYILFSERHFEHAERWFARYGSIAVLVSRVLPAVRTFISLPAGIAKMNPSRFTLYTIIGSIPWVYILALAGFALGQHWNAISGSINKLGYLFALAFIVAIVWFIGRNRPKPSR